MRILRILLLTGLGLVAFVPREAAAEGKAHVRGKSVKTKAAPAAKGKRPSKPAQAEAESSPSAEPPEDEAPKPSGEGESKVKAAGTAATQETPATKATVSEKEGPEGVKTYRFGAIEVEGRLKSPQLIYFLRRVRAEFEAGALGHRSFLGELSDTRNAAAFR